MASLVTHSFTLDPEKTIAQSKTSKKGGLEEQKGGKKMKKP
jgi:hypothetical protein